MSFNPEDRISRKGAAALARKSEDTIRRSEKKNNLAGEREIPLPHLLADLIEAVIAVFHTDPVSSVVDAEARIVPDIGKDDASGQSTYRAKLDVARQR